MKSIVLCILGCFVLIWGLIFLSSFPDRNKKYYFNSQCLYSDNIGYRILGQNDKVYILEYLPGYEKSRVSYAAMVKVEIDKELVDKSFIQIVCQ